MSGIVMTCITNTKGRPVSFRIVQANEGPTVLGTQDAHQRGESDARVLRRVGPHRKADRMNTYTPLARVVGAIEHIYAFHHGVDRGTGEFITEHIDADLLVLRPIGPDRLDDAFDRAGIRERIPTTNTIDDDLALLRCIWNPFATVSREQ